MCCLLSTCVFALFLGGKLSFAYNVEFVCETEDGKLGGCFTSCEEAEELTEVLTVSDSDRSRTRPCRSRTVCCALKMEQKRTAVVDPTVLNNSECGREFSRKFRIINGKEAKEGAHPWLVALFMENYFICGGSLITNRYVLTAAHCFNSQDPSDPIHLHRYFALLGTNLLTGVEKRVPRRLCRIAVHKKFDHKNFHNDIAIAELNEPVDITGKRIRTICLPSPTTAKEYEDVATRPYTIAGWGSTHSEITTLTSRLLEIQIAGSSTEDCNRQFNEYLDVDPVMQICAGDHKNNEKDACQGDSGGPLIARGRSGRFRVEGLASFGVGCATKGMPLGGYARVSFFIPWIEDVIEIMKQTMKSCDFVIVNSHLNVNNTVYQPTNELEKQKVQHSTL